MYHTFNFFEHTDEYQYDDKLVFIHEVECRLRKHDAAFDYSPAGYYEEADIKFPNFGGDSIRQFTGAVVEGTLPDGTAVGWQVSTDGGTSWVYYDGAAWQVAGVLDWSTSDQLAKGLPILNTRRVMLRLKMTPSSNQELTPYVNRVHLYYEGVWAFFEDIKRSIKRHIDNSAVFFPVWSEVLEQASDEITLDTAWTTVLGVDGAYNLTDDPGRLVNLYDSISGTPPVVKLTSSVPAGKTVEIQFRARCSVFLAADENLQISEVPAVVVVIPRAREDKHTSKNLFRYEFIAADNKYRRREESIPVSSTVVIYALAATEMDAQAIESGLAELFEPTLGFRSVAVGEDFFCLTYEPLTDNDIVSTGLHAKAIQVEVLGGKELRAYTEVPAVTVIGETVGPLGAIREEGVIG